MGRKPQVAPATNVLPEGALGPLETEIMQAVWAIGAATTRDVHQQLLRRRSIAYTTVMTVMGILTRKGLLERTQEGRPYVYRATMTQDELTRSHVAKVIGGLLDRFSGPALSYLIDKLDTVDEAKLAELESEVARLRRQRASRVPPAGDTDPERTRDD